MVKNLLLISLLLLSLFDHISCSSPVTSCINKYGRNKSEYGLRIVTKACYVLYREDKKSQNAHTIMYWDCVLDSIKDCGENEDWLIKVQLEDCKGSFERYKKFLEQ